MSERRIRLSEGAHASLTERGSRETLHAIRMRNPYAAGLDFAAADFAAADSDVIDSLAGAAAARSAVAQPGAPVR